ncbi:substrate-binding domain-containing protein [Phycisphaerales bacterium AB-hyl4]|uniref:Substrate-binding domain-containing protein n=1 Tax=Natronomicrosphaera hydrolytica TaxID=3242702 RepID=A0ABV4UB47_9BACT
MQTITEQSARRRNQVIRYLDRKLIMLAPGEAMPSVRQIMSDCGVSQLVVERAVGTLRDAGLVEASPRRGLFKSRHAIGMRDLASTVDIIHCATGNPPWQDRHDFTGELIYAISECCGQRGQSIRVTMVERDGSDEQYEQLLERADVKACILFQPSRNDLIERVFDPHHVPAVNLMPRNAELPRCSVVVDAQHGVAMQLEHLWSLGHRRIGFLDRLAPGKYMRTFALRREHFYRMMAEKGLKVSPTWVPYAGRTSADVSKAVEAMLNDPERPTAIIAGDTHLVAVYQTLARLGYWVGENFSVIGTDDLPVAAMMHPPTTTLRHSRKDLANMAVSLLERRLTGQEADQVQALQTKLVVRASTCSIDPS